MNTVNARFHRLLAALVVAATPVVASAQGVGDVTCDTPDVVGSIRVLTLTSDPRDDIALVRVENGVSVPLAKTDGFGAGLMECVVGPMPSNTMLLGAGSATPAYVEHGLTELASWEGFAVDLVIPADAKPLDIATIAVDFDTTGSLAEQFVLKISRSAGGTASLVVLRTDGGSVEVGSLALQDGRQEVVIGWPTAENPGTTFVVGTGSQTVAATIGADRRPRAVRVGYLGLNATPQPGDGQITLREPAFVGED